MKQKLSHSQMIDCAADIPEQKMAELKENEASKMLQTIMDTIDEHINIMSKDGTVLWHNAGRKGASNKGVVGRKCWEVFEGRNERCEHCVHPAIFADGKPRDYEAQTPSGKSYPNEWWVRANPMYNEAGEINAILEVAIDITEKKKIEREKRAFESNMIQGQKMESLGLLASGIAHDFNNILVSILGNTSLILQECGKNSPYYQQLLEIESGAWHAADLCRQMLAYSGQTEIDLSELDMKVLVEQMMTLIRSSIPKRTRLNCSFDKPLPLIMADATQIRQIIMNLVMNAAEAIGDSQGTINIFTDVSDFTPSLFDSHEFSKSLPPGRYLVLGVSDTGCGMDKETAKRIFDPFYTTKFSGRGLGLAVVHGIVHRHKGAIKVESKPGLGTTFRLFFPVSENTLKIIPDQPPARRISSLTGEGTILVVDDEPTVCSVSKRMLEMSGFKVISAQNGREGIDLFRTHSDKIVCTLLDYTMPDMNGEEVFHVLKGIRPDMKFVFSSGYSDMEAVEKLVKTGQAGFIQKPYEYKTFVDNIIQTINSFDQCKSEVIDA